MCLDPVGDLNNDFLVQSAGVAANMDVLVFVRLENGHKLIFYINFVLAFIRPLVNDLEVKHLPGPADADIKFFHPGNYYIPETIGRSYCCEIKSIRN